MRPFTLLSLALQAVLLVHASPASASSDLEARTLEERASCEGGSGECVYYYSDTNCESVLGSYRPTCGGNCFQYSSFSSVSTVGTVIPPAGVSCTIYSDNNCQNQVEVIKNGIPVQCGSYSGAQSMKCYYDC